MIEFLENKFYTVTYKRNTLTLHLNLTDFIEM